MTSDVTRQVNISIVSLIINNSLNHQFQQWFATEVAVKLQSMEDEVADILTRNNTAHLKSS